jgi:hypothetical protein
MRDLITLYEDAADKTAASESAIPNPTMIFPSSVDLDSYTVEKSECEKSFHMSTNEYVHHLDLATSQLVPVQSE